MDSSHADANIKGRLAEGLLERVQGAYADTNATNDIIVIFCFKLTLAATSAG